MTTVAEREPLTTAAPAAASGAPSAPAPQSMHSVESERLLLSVALHENRKPLLEQLLALISHDDFHVEHHGLLWSCIRNLNDAGSSHDALAVMDYTRSRNLFVGGIEYVANLNEDQLAAMASDQAVLDAAKRVKDYATRRRLHAMFLQGTMLCEQSGLPVEQLLLQAQDDLFNLRKLSETSRTGPEEIRVTLHKVLEEMQNQMDGLVTPAVSTGYDELDALIYGLADEDLILLAARPSMGKTAALMNLARNIATGPKRLPVLIFSTETKTIALGRRALSREARVNLQSIRRADLRDDDWGRISEGLSKLEDAPIWIDDTPGLGMPEIRARARAFVAKHGKCVIATDYLQNVSQGEGQRETKDHVSKVSNAHKALARELGVPVIGLSQLNRTLEARANKRPILSDLRESGSLEQDADIIIFLYRDEVYNPDTKDPGVSEWIVAKQRDGAIGTVKMGFHGPTNHFFSIST